MLRFARFGDGLLPPRIYPTRRLEVNQHRLRKPHALSRPRILIESNHRRAFNLKLSTFNLQPN